MTGAINVGRAALGWWRAHIDDSGGGDVGRKRMTRARLRRCDGAAEALGVEATHELHRMLGGTLRHRADTLALIAVVLANVRVHGRSAAALMGEGLPALRFQALVRTEDPGALIRPLRRALDQIGNAANIARLASDLFHWDERVRNGWCFEFYGALLPASPSTDAFPIPNTGTPEETPA